MKKQCSMCGKQFDDLDEQEDFCFVRHIGYGSKYDMHGLYLNLCCQCFDKIADWFLPLCEINPLRDESHCWKPVAASDRKICARLLEHMQREVGALKARLDGISTNAPQIIADLKRAGDALAHLSDHVRHEWEALEPEVGQEELPVTQQELDAAYAAGLAANDFSIGFLQRTFAIGYRRAGNIQKELEHAGRIVPVYLADRKLCSAVYKRPEKETGDEIS